MPEIKDSIDTLSIVKFDYGVLSERLNKLLPGIDDAALNTIINELIVSKHNYEKNKLKKDFKRQLDLEKRNIGKIGFRNPKELSVTVYNWHCKKVVDTCKRATEGDYLNIYDSVGTFYIENVQIAFGDGIISKINMNGWLHKKNKKPRKITFYNYWMPSIPIRTREEIDFLNTKGEYWLDAQTTERLSPCGSYWIDVADVLFYEQNIIHNYGIYIPPNGKVITLSDSVIVFDLRKESFVYDFDLRLYTDVTGLSADNPNGLIKFMGNYNLNLNSPEIPKYGTKKRYQCIKFDYANLFFNFNKIESDELVLPVNTGNDYLYSTTFDLYRYSIFDLGIDLNMIHLQLQYQSFGFNLLLGIYHTPVDSVFTINNESVNISNGVNSFYTGLKFNYKFLANEYVNVNLGYSFILPQLFSYNKFEEIYGPIDDPNSEDNIRNGYFDFNFLIHRISGELSIFSNPQDRSSFIFLKSILNFNSSDNYISLLIGYAVPFSNIFAIGQAP